MTLGDKQRRFAELVGKLIAWCYANGYELTFGECYRPEEQAKLDAQKGIGIANSLHTKRLAIDLNLFKDDVFLTTKEGYRPVGDYWKSLDPDARWGGDFSKPDSDHFSIEHEGVK